MIHHDSDLFYDIYNTITEHNQRQTDYPLLIPNYFDMYFSSESKSSFITSSALSFTMISMLSFFECITRSSSSSMEEIKLFAIVNWFFHVSDLLRLFISFRYDLISFFLLLKKILNISKYLLLKRVTKNITLKKIHMIVNQ